MVSSAVPPRWARTFKYQSDHPLASRILKYFLLFSVALALISTATQVYFDYKDEKASLQERLNFIASSNVKGLEKSLWNLDREQVQVQLQGILNFPDVVAVTLHSNDWDDVMRLGQTERIEESRFRADQFALVYQPLRSQQNQSLGTLTVYHDQKAINLRLIGSAMEIFASQTFLILFNGVVLLIIVHLKVTRYLESMASYTRQISSGDLSTPLTLDQKRPQTSPDEIDEVVNAINEMREAILEDNRRRDQAEQELLFNRDQLQEQVHRRTKSLQNAKEAAETASHAKSQFLATMSHEIRTPLNGILGTLELLLKSRIADQERDKLAAIYSASEALLEILNGLLDYARLEEGAFAPEIKEFSLRKVVNATSLLFAAQAQEQNVALEVSIAPEVIDTCYASVGALQQVLANLISNAIKFTEEGSVHVRVTQTDGRALESAKLSGSGQFLKFEVNDTGIGIPEDYRAHLFERFSQADPSITRRFGGTGLGLAITRKLVLAMGGVIDVESCEGQGSCFYFEIPMPSADGKDKEESSQPIPDMPKALNVLLVEDMPVNQQVAIDLLSSDGHKVTLARNGQEALSKATHKRYDLILLDVHLPGMSGVEVCRRIRRMTSANQDTPIIALTASVQPHDIQNYLEAGMSGVVPKPLKMSILYRAIQHTLGEGGEDKTAFSAEAAESHEPKDQHQQKESPLLNASLFEAHLTALGEYRLSGLVASFRSSCDEILPLLCQSVRDGDSYEVSEQAHRLAGDADALGAANVSKVLRTLEQSASQDDLSSACDWIDHLKESIPSTLAAMENALKSSSS
jgi:two-component system sensor histidine kinase TorS